MSSRRAALRTLAGASALAAGASAQQKQHQHADAPTEQAADKPLMAIKAPKQPSFFTKDEFATVTALVDLIIPRTGTPGAKDAGVHHLIDERVPKDDARRATWRDGLASLDKRAQARHKRRFTALKNAKQVELLTAISQETGTASRRFFDLIKGATVDGYYETRIGLETELGWHANVSLSEFPGCTHPEHKA